MNYTLMNLIIENMILKCFLFNIKMRFKCLMRNKRRHKYYYYARYNCLYIVYSTFRLYNYSDFVAVGHYISFGWFPTPRTLLVLCRVLIYVHRQCIPRRQIESITDPLWPRWRRVECSKRLLCDTAEQLLLLLRAADCSLMAADGPGRRSGYSWMNDTIGL